MLVGKQARERQEEEGEGNELGRLDLEKIAVLGRHEGAVLGQHEEGEAAKPCVGVRGYGYG